MNKKWANMIAQVIGDFDSVNSVKCPNCGECEIDYIYIGDEDTRIGFFQIWCNNCLKGIYVSRASAPPNAKFATFNSDIKNIVPKFELEN